MNFHMMINQYPTIITEFSKNNSLGNIINFQIHVLGQRE